MPTFIMRTSLSADAVDRPEALRDLERRVVDRIRETLPDVEWKASYATLGPDDYLDIFTAPDVEAAMQVATLVRAHGHARTDVWPAVEWARFKELVADISG